MSTTRHLLVVAHTGRDDSLQAGVQVCRQLIEAGLVPVLSADEHAAFLAAAPDLAPLSLLGVDVHPDDLELVIVLGGDGTILRAAELARSGAARPSQSRSVHGAARQEVRAARRGLARAGRR